MNKKIIIWNCVILVIVFIVNIFAVFYFFQASDTEFIYKKNILKVVEIKATSEDAFGYATGFFIDSDGTILTNKHVVYNTTSNSNYNKIQVRLADEDEWINAELIKVSDIDDLAIIKIKKTNTNFFNISESISNGQEIYTIGNPNGFGLSFANGVVSSSERNVIHNEQIIKTIQTSFVINEGNSGGPVFDKNGNLLGIISFRLKDNYNDVIQGISFALPSSTINAFLQG